MVTKKALAISAGSLAAATVIGGGVVVAFQSSGAPTCDRDAAPATLTTELAAAADGQTICLADGNYGTWKGVDKAVTLRSANGQNASMALQIGMNAARFSLESVTILYNGNASSTINGPAHDITIRDSQFTGQVEVNDTQNANILFENDSFPFKNAVSDPARLQVSCTSTAFCDKHVPAGVTVRDSYLTGGDADGLWTNTGGVVFDHNEFVDICNTGATGNHTDNIQVGIGRTAVGVTITRNLIRQTTPCQGQGIGIYDGISHSTITDNVVQMAPRQWPFEIYSDDTSLVAHNVVVDHGVNGTTNCNGNPCGVLMITAKDACATGSPPTCGDAGVGTIVTDNIARAISVGKATLGRRDHNLVQTGAAPGDITGVPVFVGGANPTTWEGFCLAANSPGKGAASDGLDVGIRCGVTPSTSETTTSTTTTEPTTPTTTVSMSPVVVTPPLITVTPPLVAPEPITPDPITVTPPVVTPPLITPAPVTITPAPVTLTPVATTAVFTVSPNPVVGQPVSFDAVASSCAASPCTYRWEDDGADGPGGTQWSLGTGQQLVFTFTGAGTKQVRLTVTDANGGTATVVRGITVG